MNILFYLVPKSNVVFVYDDYTIGKAMDVMEKERYMSVPVLARDGSYVGSLSEGDILWGLKERPHLCPELLEQLRVRQFKRQRDNQPVNINCTMEQLAHTAVNQNFIPVVDDNRTFIGIVTRKSVMNYFLTCREKEEEETEMRGL